MIARQISASEVRVGDTITLSANYPRYEYSVAVTGKVRAVMDTGLYVTIGNERGRQESAFSITGREVTITLLDRPEPPRLPGSLWRDPMTDACYVRTSHEDRYKLHYRRFAGERGASGLSPGFEAAAIARLEPLEPVGHER